MRYLLRFSLTFTFVLLLGTASLLLLPRLSDAFAALTGAAPGLQLASAPEEGQGDPLHVAAALPASPAKISRGPFLPGNGLSVSSQPQP